MTMTMMMMEAMVAKASVRFPSILTVLTEDLLLRILDMLIENSHRKSWSLVCKEFLRLESIHRRSLRVFRHDSLPRLLRRYQFLDLLDLSACPCVDDATMALLFGSPYISFSARWIKTLVLSRTSALRSGGLEVVVRSFPCLQEIDLSYCCGFGDRDASALSHAQGLKVLKLVKCLRVTDFGLAKIVVGCVKLENLSLKWCLKITDLGIELLSKKCTALRILDLSYLKVTNKSLHSISSLWRLEVLYMVGCSSVDDDGLHFLSNGNPSLQCIDVSRCNNVSSRGLLSVVRGHKGLHQITTGYSFSELSKPLVYKLSELRNLKSINVYAAGVSDWSLEIIGNNCKHLVEIGLSKCAEVTNLGVKKLVASCSDLKILDLTCCHLITDAALSAIADSCKNLLCLKLESCNLITQMGLGCLGSCCLLLEELDLTDCMGVNDAGLEQLSRCMDLLCLKLGLCMNISDKGLSHIGHKCTKLLELDLYRCKGIGDYGLAAIASGCKKLKKLNICYCVEISDEGLKHLSTLEELVDLEMRSLLKVTSVGLTAIAVGCKSLAELDMKRCCGVCDAGFWALAHYSPNIRQINLSQCRISDVALYIAMGKMKCLQVAKLVHLTHVSVEGFELALRASCIRLKKLKLLSTLMFLLSSELLQVLQARGCKIRWMEKALILD
ncbi:F-box/LRR-repeat protein 3 isoform X1 [Macadamia integrifolia]|uniref:F-box/LRR-repeat protein 3 isoform X1 n=1 Tax=Macadamia integrifolia TaxID=60698 RepID=UPI001C5276D1|nr:F-box/LRR-repeat protein 3 isoform X1 [Macadamia integrifolia]